MCAMWCAMARAQATGRLPSNQVLQLNLVLPLRDQAGLESFLKELYDPGQSFLPAVPHAAGVHRALWADAGRLRRGGSLRKDLRVRGRGRLARWHGRAGEGHRGRGRSGVPREHAHLQASRRRTATSIRRTASRRSICRSTCGTFRGWITTPFPIPCWSTRMTMRRPMESMRTRWCLMPPPAPALRLRSWAATCARLTTAAAA